MTRRRSTVLELAGNGGAVAVTKLKGLVLIAVLTRMIGIEGYGVWAQALVLAELAGIVANLGLPNALVYFYPRRDDDGRRQLIWTCYLLVLGAALPLSVALAATAGFMARVFATGGGDTGTFVAAAVVAPALALRLLLLSIWRADNRLHRYSAASVATDVTDMVVVFLGARATRSATGAAVAYALAVWTETVVLVVLHWARSGGIRGIVDHRRLLRYSLPIVPSALSMEGLARADRLIVGAVAGAASAGIYSSLYAIASSLTLVSQPFTNVLLPKLTRLRSDRVRAALRRYVLGYLALSAPLFVIVVALSAPIANIIIGSGTDGSEARVVVALAGLGTLLLGVGRTQAMWLLATERTPALLKVSAIAAVGNVVLNLVLVPAMGITGAALATLLSYTGYVASQWFLLEPGDPVPTPAGDGSAATAHALGFPITDD